MSLDDGATPAVHGDPQLSTNAVCLLDVPLAAWCADALALLPEGGLEDAVDEGELSAMRHEVVHDVVHVAAAPVNGGAVTHSRPCEPCAPDGAVPADLTGIAAGFDRIGLAVGVAGYGGGALSIVVVAFSSSSGPARSPPPPRRGDSRPAAGRSSRVGARRWCTVGA